MSSWVIRHGLGREVVRRIELNQVADAIARQDDQTWSLLHAAERDRYLDLARAALEAAGAEPERM